jgi:hypothetical protein
LLVACLLGLRGCAKPSVGAAAAPSAPGDAAGSAPLAMQRAGDMRKHLLAWGVRLQQLGPPIAVTAAGVRLRAGLPAH